MKSIVTLLLFLLFASCGKQEVYEFEKSESFEPEKTYYTDQNGTIVKFQGIGWWRMAGFDDRYTRIVEKFPLRIYTHFKFEPIDEDGFCFFSYNGNGSISPHTDPEQKYEIKTEINGVTFFDKKYNQLFTLPFDDEYDVQKHSKRFQSRGKTKLVTRTLLERVDIEKTKIRIFSYAVKKEQYKVRDIYNFHSSKQ